MTRLGFCCSFLAGCVFLFSCGVDTSPGKKMTMKNARIAEVRGYQSSDPEKAKAALLSFREEVVSTRGFGGLMNVHKSVLVSDARLFAMCRQLGQTNEAAYWYASYLTNLNAVRSGGGNHSLPSPAEVIALTERLDRNLDVAWKSNLTHQKKTP